MEQEEIKIIHEKEGRMLSTSECVKALNDQYGKDYWEQGPEK